MSERVARAAHYPGRAPIDAYGNGGFRFAGMSHRGAILCLPSGVWSWQPPAPELLTVDALAAVLAERAAIGFLLLGTGEKQVFPPAEVRRAFMDMRLGLETMTTGAAARTYNVLLAEGRPVAAALLAVE